MAHFHFHPPSAPVAIPRLSPPRSDRRVRLLWLLAGVLMLSLALLAYVEIAYAGGPAHVAGASYFNASAKGNP